jgi:hypothetical protein
MSEIPSRAHTCPVCNVNLTAHNEAEFDQLWEAHRAEHRSELDEVAKNIKAEEEGVAPGPDAELSSAAAKAKALSRQVEDSLKGEDDHLNDIERHYGALTRIEHKLPQLIDFAFKLANAVGNLCREKEYRPRALKAGNIFWTPSGEISAELTYDPYAITTEAAPEYLKRGYARLPKLHDDYPAVFEVTMTLGEHLVNILNNRRIDARDISFTGLHYFHSPVTNSHHWAFKIVNRKFSLKHAGAGL